jgi:hypothetical protein
MPENDAGLKAHMQKAATEAGAGELLKSTAEEEVPTGDEVVAEEEQQVEEEKKEEAKSNTFDPLAKEWGWKPKKDFEADPDNEGKQWVDAETYVRNIKPISDSYRKGQRELQRQLDQSTKLIQTLVSKQEAADKRAAEAEKRAKQEILSELNSKLDEAVDNSDRDSARKLTQQIASLTSEINAPEPVAEKEKQVNDDLGGDSDEGAVPASKSPTVARWMGRNEKSGDNPNGWYNDTDDPINAALTLFADKRSIELGKDDAGNPRTWKEIFSDLDVELAQKRAALQARMAPPKATREGSSAGGGTPISNKEAKVSDLSDEEVKAGRQFVRRGAFKNMAEYAKALRS